MDGLGRSTSFFVYCGMKKLLLLISIAFIGCSEQEEEYNCIQCYVSGVALNDICQEDLIDNDMTIHDLYNTSHGVYVNLGDTSGVIYCEYHN